MKQTKKKIVCCLCLLLTCVFLSACASESTDTSSAVPSAPEPVSTAASEEPSEVSEEESSAEQDENRVTYTITEDELYDKILGSWLGQAAGVVWGADQEFWYCGTLMPENTVPEISSLNLNGVFWQDDLYVEIPFMEVMRKNGVNCPVALVAEEFKNTEFSLDHANKKGRENLRNGIPAPLSGSYLYNYHCDDIDWQIEADFLGCIYPAMVSASAERAFELGHITNYGDGVYGGVFVSAMHSAAFYAESVDEIIRAGLTVIPEGTKFREMMDDVLKWHSQGLTWQQNWLMVMDKWDKTRRCLTYSSGNANIDAKMNAAYILIGMLYGEGDFDESMRISMMCGMDSDCNPSSVGAILGNFYGYKAIDSKWKTLDMTGTKFSYTDYSFTNAVKLNSDLAAEQLELSGAVLADGVWTITVDADLSPVEFEQWPDRPSAEISVSNENGSNYVHLSVHAHDLNGISSISWNMGDGTVCNSNISLHRYGETGTYKVVCSITSESGVTITEEAEITVTSTDTVAEDPNAGTYRNIARNGYIMCSDYAPTGSGSKNIEVIRDGVKRGSNLQQYDTYAGYFTSHEDHIGYAFPKSYTVDKIVFTEGMHFNNGGWFVGETFRAEILTDGEWKAVEGSVWTPEYPTGNYQSNYGEFFETYTVTFPPVSCDGIRLVGTAGGDAGFVGVAELEVYGND